MSNNSNLFQTIFLDNAKLNYIESYLCNFNTKKDKVRQIKVTLPDVHTSDVIDNFNKLLNLPIDTFEVEKELDDVVYKFDDNLQLKYYSEICNSLDIGTNRSNENQMMILTEMPSPSNLKFIIHKLQYKLNEETQDIFIVSKQDRIALNKQKNLFMRTDDDFRKIDNSKFYIFNSSITCIFVEDDIYVVDYKKFIDLFNYKEYLQNKVNNVINIFKSERIISNFEQFKEALSSYRNFNSLTKVSEDATVIKNFLRNENNIRKIELIQNQFECYFEFNSKTPSFQINEELGLKIMIRIISNRAGFDFEDNPVTFASKYSLKRRGAIVPPV